MTRNFSPLYCDTFYIAGRNSKVVALSKQTHIVSISCNCHSGYCMSAAIKASPERLAIYTYRRPLLTAKVKVRNQQKMLPFIIRAFIHLLCQIRKLRRRADLIGIIFLTRPPPQNWLRHIPPTNLLPLSHSPARRSTPVPPAPTGPVSSSCSTPLYFSS